MKKITSLFFVCLVTLSLTSCHLFESTKISAKEILTASEWSSNDIGPSFDSCEPLEGEELTNCFKNIISTTLKDYLNSSIPEVNQSIQEEILLVLKIDQEGNINFGEIDLPESLIDAIPDIKNILSDAIYQLPQAKPAIKSNVGAFVVTEFQLPILIFAQESN